MSDNIDLTIGVVIARAPEWIRADLAGKDVAARARAEEALAAMIGAALSDKSKSKRSPARKPTSRPAITSV